MEIANHYTANLELPNSQIVPVRGSVKVSDADWKAMSDNVVVAAWLESKMLVKGKAEAEAPPKPVDTKPDFEAMSEDDLRLVLEQRGVEVDGRWGKAKLVTEAKKLA